VQKMVLPDTSGL